MSGKVIAIRRKNSGDSIEKASADYQKELREIISIVESAKTRLSKMTIDMEAENICRRKRRNGVGTETGTPGISYGRREGRRDPARF